MKPYLVNAKTKREAKIIEPFLIGALFVVIQGCGLVVASSGLGLDSSWVWLTSRATQLSQYSNGDYVWTNGPLSFLDFQQHQWWSGFFIAMLFRILAGLLTYSLFFATTNPEKIKNKNLRVIISVLITSFCFTLNTPTMMLVYCLLLLNFYDFKNISPKLARFTPFILGAITSIEFFTKSLQFFLALLFSFLISYRIAKIRGISKVTLSFLSFSILIMLILNFTLEGVQKYLFGLVQLSIGYKAMAIEDRSRLLEYPMILLLFVFIVLFLKKISLHFSVKLGIGISAYSLFVYGFTRHDGHSTNTFFFAFLLIWLFYSTPSESLIQGENLILTISILCIILNTSISLISLFDVTYRITNFRSVLSSVSGSNRVALDSKDINGLKAQMPISDLFLKTINSDRVAIFPFDQLLAYAYNLNSAQPPVPQLYSAYTPWLDKIDADFFSGLSAPRFILEASPAAIDGRNPIWEAPLTQLSILCNYQVKTFNETYLLLEKRIHPVCNIRNIVYSTDRQKSLKSDFQKKEIFIFKYQRNLSLFQRVVSTIFKPISHDQLTQEKSNWVMVARNNQALILSTPEEVDLPGKWSYNQHSSLTSRPNYTYIPGKLKIH